MANSLFLCGQEMRVIAGTLKDETSGEPIPGVNISVEGTTNGVATNIDGKYQIYAPLGSTLIYSFVGYNPQKVIVTVNNSNPVEESLITRPLKQNDSIGSQENTIKKKAEVRLKSSYSPILQILVEESDSMDHTTTSASFQSNAPVYRLNRVQRSNFWYDIDPNRIKRIQFGDKEVKIVQQWDKYLQIPHVTFSSSFSLDRSILHPKLQSIYAQGRPMSGTIQWQGPETAEIFSFGPALQNLEFDGSSYSYDKTGRLVSKGTGNGNPAQAYDPLKFFRNGFTLTNALQINTTQDKMKYSVLYTNKRINGVIPTAYKNSNIFGFIFEKQVSWNFRLNNNFSYEDYRSRLMSGSPVTSFLLASVYTTPPSFDNSNGLSSREASKHDETYLINNTQRSYSGLSNNPYWLVNHLLDKERYKSLKESFGFKVELLHDLSLSVDGTISNQTFGYTTGYSDGTNGLNTIQHLEQDQKLFSVGSLSSLNYYLNTYGSFGLTLNSQLSHSFKYTSISDKSSLVNNQSGLQNRQNQPFMRVHNIGWVNGVNFDDKFLVRVTQNLIYNEFPSVKQQLYSPSLSAGVNVHNLIDFYKRDFLNYFKIRGSWGYMYSEMPLLFNYGSYAYQEIGAEQFQQAFFGNDLIPDFTLQPEKILKKDVGVDLGFFNNRLTLTADYYQNTTYHGIFPTLESGVPVLKNCADYRTHGFEFNLAYQTWRRDQWSTVLKFNFTRARNKVTALYANQYMVPIAGFGNVHTALVEGLPYGVIVGTSYLRDTDGKRIIGDNGYPIVSSALRVIADPNPDFVLGFEAAISFKNLNFRCLSELSVGGKIWNGTENVLSYYGVSQSSSEQRNIAGYVYSGVTTEGSPNSIPVDFANPAKPFSENRWQQYGPAGVAEDAIQDATFFRISELAITYSIRNRNRFGVEIRGFITNPLFIASSKGLDPRSVLWSNAKAKGLQLFNMPTVSSIGLGFLFKL